ncbi:hypothetical protein [Streptomyces katsurahamanus]|uniref:Uncharacterized protein n=1 Tax=Streptomyces katsurahamanus TaxID=2577098 RepID=A0ABW9P0C7_9ACTN|nr:hypothetical protein [Streptomyces katsurahamanus]MQS38992.1 hypothetical protein [Streptomyces katsurahamanus]
MFKGEIRSELGEVRERKTRTPGHIPYGTEATRPRPGPTMGPEAAADIPQGCLQSRAELLPDGRVRIEPGRPTRRPGTRDIWPDMVMVPRLMTTALTVLERVAAEGRDG